MTNDTAKKFNNSLNNFSKALKEVITILKSNSKNNLNKKTVDLFSASSKSFNNINLIIKDVKAIRAETENISKKQDNILTELKANRKQKESGMFSKIKGKDNKKSIMDGVKTIILIAAAVVAIGFAFKLVGKVDFPSVIALAIAMPLLAYAVEKASKIKMNLKGAIAFVIGAPLVALGVTIAARILQNIDETKFNIKKILVAISIAAVLTVIAYGAAQFAKAINIKNPAELLYLPVMMILLAGAIVGASWLLVWVNTDFNFNTMITSILVAITLALIGILLALPILILSKLNVVKALMGSINLIIVAAAVAISSWVLSIGNYTNYPDIAFVLAIGLMGLLLAIPIAVLGLVGIPTVAQGAVGLIILALAIAIIAAIFEGLGMTDIFYTIADAISYFAKKMIDVVGYLIQTIGPGLAAFIDLIGPPLGRLIKEILPPLAAGLKLFIEAILPPLGIFINQILPGIKDIIKVILDHILKHIQIIITGVSTILDSVSGLIDSLANILNAIGNIVEKVGGVIIGIIKQIGDSLEQLFSSIIRLMDHPILQDSAKAETFSINLVKVGAALAAFAAEMMVTALLNFITTLIGGGGMDSLIVSLNKIIEQVPKVNKFSTSDLETFKSNMSFLGQGMKEFVSALPGFTDAGTLNMAGGILTLVNAAILATSLVDKANAYKESEYADYSQKMIWLAHGITKFIATLSTSGDLLYKVSGIQLLINGGRAALNFMDYITKSYTENDFAIFWKHMRWLGEGFLALGGKYGISGLFTLGSGLNSVANGVGALATSLERLRNTMNNSKWISSLKELSRSLLIISVVDKHNLEDNVSNLDSVITKLNESGSDSDGFSIQRMVQHEQNAVAPAGGGGGGETESGPDMAEVIETIKSSIQQGFNNLNGDIKIMIGELQKIGRTADKFSKTDPLKPAGS